VKEFLRQGAEVELAVVKANAGFFREVFPELRQRVAPGYNVVYPKYGFNMALWLLKNSAHLNAVMRYEKRYAEEMVERHGYDVLFSDNRFAFFSKKAYSVYMTHQRRIAFPPAVAALEGVGVRWHRARMRNFDEVWVPDVEAAPGYAGALSHLPALRGERASRGVGGAPAVRFVGPLSRFDEIAGSLKAGSLNAHELPAGALKAGSLKAGSLDAGNKCAGKYRVVAVISGVEPARTQFENRLRDILRDVPGEHLMILGKPQAPRRHWTEGNIEFVTHLPTGEFARAVRDADWVISRGGYSTVMDMAYLGAKCIFVPTPGQYEQVVLARDLATAGYAVSIPANRLSVESLLDAFKGEVALPRPQQAGVLENAVKDLFSRVGDKISRRR
jgi:UDP-N-acetylglucosamine transferase subunit ALG13